jgi:hypothetical protein
MTKQELLKLKIEMALARTAIDALLYARDKKTWSEVSKRMAETKEELYKSIASLEPDHESRVV